MSEMKNFDEHLRRSFSGYSPEVPAHIWENIAASRKKRRPVAAWFVDKKLLGAALLSAVLITGAILLFNRNGNTDTKPVDNKYTNTTGANDFTPAASPEPSTQTEAVTTGNQDMKIPITDHGQASSSGNEKLTAVNGPNHPAQNISKYEQASRQNRNKNILMTGDERQNIADTRSTSDPTGMAEDEPGNTVKANTAATGFFATPLYFNIEKLAAASLANTNKPEMKGIIIPGCPPDKDAAADKQYWEVYAGPDYAFKKYHDTANSVLLEKRKASTNFQYAFSAGARYTRVFSNGISIRAGLNYSQVNEKFSYVQSNVVQMIYEINTNGDTVNSYYVRGTKYKTSYNHYRMVDLPLSMGYELGYGRLHANINAGPVINLYSWQKGETLDSTLKPVSFNSGKNNAIYQYKTNVGLGFMGAVSVYYRLNDRLHVLAEPYYRYNFSPINKGTPTIQEKFSIMGVRLGLRVDLE